MDGGIPDPSTLDAEGDDDVVSWQDPTVVSYMIMLTVSPLMSYRKR